MNVPILSLQSTVPPSLMQVQLGGLDYSSPYVRKGSDLVFVMVALSGAVFVLRGLMLVFRGPRKGRLESPMEGPLMIVIGLVSVVIPLILRLLD